MLPPSSDEYYPTVSVNALMKILRDPTLNAYHNMVIPAVMFIIKSLGIKCVAFLPQILPPFFDVMRNCEQGFRDYMFQQLGVLVSIVKQHIRDYLPEIFQLIEKYWPSPNLAQIVLLVEEISLALNDEFKVYLPDLIPHMLAVLRERSNTKAIEKILKALEVIGTNLDDYLHLLIPAVVKLFEKPDTPMNLRTASIKTVCSLCRKLNFSDYSSRIIHPLARILDNPLNPGLREDALETLCALIYQLGPDYVIYIPMVNRVLARQKIQSGKYEGLISHLLKNHPLVNEDDTDLSVDLEEQPPAPEVATIAKLKVNATNLKKAWENSHRSTKEDWQEWIRRFSVEILRESPSPALRSCLSLAQDYHPLVTELFSPAFLSCWKELSEAMKEELVRSIETALKAPTIPPEILQQLLNLAEFMVISA